VKVYSKRDKSIPAEAVLVDRSSDWGNPFIMHKEWERDIVVNQFECYALWRLTIDPDWLLPLRGKDLVCWCKPKRCHADVLLELANK
jgi:hypothetical protein